MEILSFNSLESTQLYLIEQIKNKSLTAPICIVAKEQTAGIGSRDNSWEGGEGNLFFSFAISIEDLPKDLPLSSASIYFSFIMKEILNEKSRDFTKLGTDGFLTESAKYKSLTLFGTKVSDSKKNYKKFSEDVWLKWPNDLYQNSSKIGGTITKKIDNILLCGMGINLQKNSNGFKALNLNVEPIDLLNEYLSVLENCPTWKQIFSLYRIEFYRNKGYFTHVDGKLKPLKDAILSEDGSLIIKNKRVYSIR